jgi:hypothetical protein
MAETSGTTTIAATTDKRLIERNAKDGAASVSPGYTLDVGVSPAFDQVPQVKPAPR